MSEISMCTTAACFYDWVKDFQALVAALIAIGAALLAYFGARAQANAVLRTARDNRASATRAAAAAMWAELAFCVSKLTTDTGALRHGDFLKGGHAVIRPFQTPVYDANPGDVGKLPSDEAYAVAHAYQLIKSLDETYRDALKAHVITAAQTKQLSELADHVCAVVKVLLTGLRSTAGISEVEARKTMDLYEEFASQTDREPWSLNARYSGS